MSTRFFCESCSTEVSAGAESCPRCGKIFTGVRCPRCGFEGSESDFRSGCKSCGYMEPLRPSRTGPSRGAGRPPRRPQKRLPWGYYRAALLGLAAAALVLLAILLFAT